jgi:alkanesulfonate monooxygenase SsuD/methylene tetrahydromethanopterin reductase-like flavin-dependent oxidoreductase (luciferase family)
LRYTAGDLLRLAGAASDAGFRTVWVNDSFEARQTYSLLGAIAARSSTDLGTLVTYPFARNPIDFSTTLGTIGELMGGQEFRMAMSTGAPTQQGLYVERPIPTQMVEETILLARRLLAGDDIRLGDYPALAAYYHLKADARFRMSLEGGHKVSFWIPPHGPRMLELTARICDGVILDTVNQYASLPSIRNGTLARTLADMDRMRAEAGNTTPLRRILKVGMSIAEDRDEARAFARNFVSFQVAGHIDRYRELGFPSDQLDALEKHYREGGSIAGAAQYVGPELIDQVVLAGSPADVAERFTEYVSYADELGIEEVIIGVPVGPDPFKAIELATQELLPKTRAMLG